MKSSWVKIFYNIRDTAKRYKILVRMVWFMLKWPSNPEYGNDPLLLFTMSFGEWMERLSSRRSSGMYNSPNLPRRGWVLLCLWVYLCQPIITVDAITSKSSWSMTLKSISSPTCLTPRRAFISAVATTLLWGKGSTRVRADETMDTATAISTSMIVLEKRDRKGNQDAVIRDDYWYVTGKLPPRLLTTQLKGDDPQWNAFGSCTTSESTGTNSCTYVSINQRRSAYNKYASSISYGASEYQKLGTILDAIQKSPTSTDVAPLWHAAADLVSPSSNESMPSATVDAELKMVLFATAMLTSPNFPGPSRELLVARFYANEVRFAHRALYECIVEHRLPEAQNVYDFGRDSWNSYFQTVARSIVPKVGDPLPAVP